MCAAEREPPGPARDRALRNAKQAVDKALKITKKYLACRPQALREQGLIAALNGQSDQSKRSFEESLKVADAHEARYEHAKTMLAMGEAGIKFGWPDAESQVSQATAVIKTLEDF